MERANRYGLAAMDLPMRVERGILPCMVLFHCYLSGRSKCSLNGFEAVRCRRMNLFPEAANWCQAIRSEPSMYPVPNSVTTTFGWMAQDPSRRQSNCPASS
jgi:hypothetical protein